MGSVRQVTNGNGALTYVANYDPYGNVLELAGSQSATGIQLGYIGGTDPNGLAYLNTRYYNPSLGSFLSLDPQIR